MFNKLSSVLYNCLCKYTVQCYVGQVLSSILYSFFLYNIPFSTLYSRFCTIYCLVFCTVGSVQNTAQCYVQQVLYNILASILYSRFCTIYCLVFCTVGSVEYALYSSLLPNPGIIQEGTEQITAILYTYCVTDNCNATYSVKPSKV